MRLNYRFLLAISFVIANMGNTSFSYAQIKSDRSVGTRVNQRGKVIEINGGKQAGNNLFHSFREFSVPKAREAFFNNNSSVVNIFNRVTGGNQSKIEGLIRTKDANLILINPNGIIFSSGAKLQLGNGSFLATTAESLIFQDGTIFKATEATKPLLTISVPIGLGINDSAAPIQVKNTKLEVNSDHNIALIGGNIKLTGGHLIAPGGRIELGGLSQTAIVELGVNFYSTYPEGIEAGDLFLENKSSVSVIALGGGDIGINVRDLQLSGNSVIETGINNSKGNADIISGDININATREIRISGQSKISNDVLAKARGNAGDINITTGSLSLTNAQISSSTYGQGNGGTVTIKATALIQLDGINRDDFLTSVFSIVDIGGVGNAGGVLINTKYLEANNLAQIDASTLGIGNGGSVIINATEWAKFDGSKNIFPSGVFSLVLFKASGNGGSIEINTKTIELTNGAQIVASTFAEGNAGNVTINASELARFDGVSKFDEIIQDSFPTGVFSGVDINGVGKGGSININAKSLEVSNGAQINTSTYGRGGAGDIHITADTVRLSPNGDITTFVSQDAGGGGNITINANSILAFDDSDILAYSVDDQGGNIILNTPAFFGQGYNPSSSEASPEELSNNGRVDVNASGKFSTGTISLPNVSFVENSLAQFSTVTIDTQSLIANSCLARSPKKQGSFVILGGGGLAYRPGEVSNSVYPTTTVRSLPQPQTTTDRQETIIEPLGVYSLENGELILGRECQ